MARTLGVVRVARGSFRHVWGLVGLLALAGAPGCGSGGSPPECTTALECDDDDVCTADACSDAGECVHSAAADGVACDDGLFCTDGDECVAGSCSAGAGEPCDGATPVCSEALGACVECAGNGDCVDDGVFCNGIEACSNNACVSPGNPCVGSPTTPVCDVTLDGCVACSGASDCNDGNPCTDDVCGTDGACTNPANDTSSCADDGVFCNGAESCSGGACVSDGVDPCAGGVLPFCDLDADACVECASPADCDDEVFCNGAERCVDGSCEAPLEVACPDAVNGCDEDRAVCLDCNLAGDCDDGDACTLERCNAGSCERGSCPSGTTCTQGVCAGCADAGDCNDGNPCTTDTCDGGSGECSWPSVTNGTGCDDGLFCTAAGATCIAGTCLALGGPTCTGNTPVCDEQGDACAACMTASDCDDGNACTTDVCNGNGSCTRTPVVCADDGVACTITHCDTTLGCTATSVRDTFVALQFEDNDTLLSVRGRGPTLLVQSGLFLCTGPGACVAAPGPLPLSADTTLDLPLSAVLANVPVISGGELALSTTSDGSEVCDYVRWSDTMSTPPTALGTAAANQGEWTGTCVDTSTAPAAPPVPGICWLDVWSGGQGTAGNDAPTEWGYCPHCGDCGDADPCTYDYCDEDTSLCVHDDALTESLAGVNFTTDTVSLQNVSSAVDDLPIALGVCTAGSMASCEILLGTIPTTGRDVVLGQDLMGAEGELAMMVSAGAGGFQLCDYVRWSAGAPVSSTTLSTQAEAAGEWTSATAVSSSGASRIVHSGVGPNSSVLEWSGMP